MYIGQADQKIRLPPTRLGLIVSRPVESRTYTAKSREAAERKLKADLPGLHAKGYRVAATSWVPPKRGFWSHEDGALLVRLDNAGRALCPSCGAPSSGKFCQSCGAPAERPAEPAPTSPAPSSGRSPALAGAVVCLLIGLLLMPLSLGTMIVYGPLFLAAFILSVVAMAQGRVLGGVMALVATVILPLMVGVAIYAIHDVEREQALAKVVIEDVVPSRRGTYATVEGRVRNTGNASVKFVKVQVQWLDRYGTVLETQTTYAVDGDPLGPGQAKTFSVMGTPGPDSDTVTYRVLK